MDTPTELQPDDVVTFEELTRLNVFLSSNKVSDETLLVDELDGFLAALVCGPDPVPPSDWMPVVWGGESPAWESKREAREILDLVVRLWQNCARSIDAGSDYAPILAIRSDESGEAVPTAEGWCYGFTLGIQLRGDLWLHRTTPTVRKLLAPVGAFLSEEARDDMGGLSGDPMSNAQLISAIPPMVHGLRAYWLGKETTPPDTTERSGAPTRKTSRSGSPPKESKGLKTAKKPRKAKRATSPTRSTARPARKKKRD